MVLVQSVIKRLPNTLYPTRKNTCRTHGCKGSLLKVKKEKYKGKHGGSQKLREPDLCSSGAFKT
jgi:hypothetical protein